LDLWALTMENSLRILIVDNDELLAAKLCELVTDMGHLAVGPVAAGEQALDLVFGQAPDAILMGISLDGPMDGVEVAKLTRVHQDIPVIFFGASEDELILRQAAGVGGNSYLTKPVLASELRVSLEMAIYKQAAEKRFQHLNQVLLAVREVNKVITREQDRQRLLDEVVNILVRTRGYRFVWIGQLAGSRMNILARASDGSELLDRIWAKTDAAGVIDLPCTQASLTGQVALCADMLADPLYTPWHEEIGAAGLRSSLAVPMVYQQELFGVLSVYVGQTNGFDQQEINLLIDLTDDIAFGLTTIAERDERKKAEEKLRQREKSFRLMLESSIDGVVAADANHRVLYQSPSSVRLNGFSMEERLGRDLFEIVHPDDLEEISGGWDYLLLHPDETVRVDYRIKSKDGLWRWAESTAQNLLMEPDIQAVVITSRDISEHRNTEDALRQRTAEQAALNQIGQALNKLTEPAQILEIVFEQVGLVLDNRNLYIALYDPERRYISFPIYTIDGERLPAAGRYLGNGITDQVIRTNAALLVTQNLPEYLQARGVELIGKLSKSLIAVPMRVDGRVIGVIALQDYEQENRYDEHHIELLTTVAAQAAVALENAHLYAAVREELQERQKAEDLLRRSEAKFRAVVDYSNESIIFTDADNRISYRSSSAARMNGYSAEEREGRVGLEVVHPDDLSYTRQVWLEAVANPGAAFQVEYRTLHKNGTWVWVEATIHNLLDNPYVREMVITGRDITARKQAEFERERLLVQVITERDETDKTNGLLNGILDRINDGFVAYDANLNYTYVNARAGELLARIPEDLVGKSFWTENPDERAKPFAEACIFAMEKQQPIVMEEYYAQWDRWFVNRIYPSQEGITVFFTDITDRKRSDLVLSRLNRELRAISNCNQALVRAEDEQTILNDICQIVCDEAGYRMVWVGYAEQDQAKTVRPVAWAGYEDGYLSALNISWEDKESGRGPAGTAIRSGHTTCMQDFANDPRVTMWREDALRRGYQSVIGLPLKDDHDSVFGVVVIYSGEANAFSPTEIRLLEELAGDLAFGITVLRSREKREQLDKLQRESEVRFRALSEDSLVGVYIVQSSQLTYINLAMARIFGYSPDDLIGTNPVDLAHPEDRALVRENIRRRMEGEAESIQYQFRGVCKNGEIRYVEAMGTRADLNNQPTIIGNIIDVSERTRVETALRESEDQYYNLFENMQNGFVLLEVINDSSGNPVDHRLLQANAEFEAQNNLDRTVEIGQTSAGLSFKWSDDVAQRYYAIAIDGGAFHHEWFNEAVGRHYDVRAFCPRKGQWAMLLSDISERKLRENEVRAIVTLSAALRKAANRTEMLPVILRQVMNLIRCDAITIEIIDPQSGDVIVEAAYGMWENLVGLCQPKGTGINAVISKTLQAYHTQDLENDPNQPYPLAAHIGLRGGVGVPLIAQERLIGFVWVGAVTEIPKSEVQLFSAIADIAASAITRSTLHEQTQKSAADLELTYDITLEGWARALELRDQETEGHTRRVTQQTVDLAKRMGLTGTNLENIRRGALLHDIGKMGIPDSVLLKPGTLNEREWEIMRRHPEHAYRLLHQIDYLREALEVSYCHHEKWDGSGYPRGLKGDKIPLNARIFAIVDVWDALTSDRPYRLAWSDEEALLFIRQQSGRHFDPIVVSAFLEMRQNDQNGKKDDAPSPENFAGNHI
jgi:PAS domain S-box-containing protein/putative nucleotidyltransferase with HDIG domain